MKPPKIEPIWMSGLGLVVAPLLCGFNVTLAALFNRDIEPKQALGFSFGVAVFALLVFFPLGLLSEQIVQLWNGGQTKKSRFLSALYGIGALLFFLFFTPLFQFNLVAVAALLIPYLWSLLLILFALLARPPQR